MIDIVNIRGKEIIFIDELSFAYPLDIDLSTNDEERISEAGKKGYSVGSKFREILEMLSHTKLI